MAKIKIRRLCCFIAFDIMVMYGNFYAAGATEGFKMFKMVTSEREIVNSVSKNVELEKWPKSNILRSAPKIDKTLLSNPALVTEETFSYVPDLFEDVTKGVLLRWHLKRSVENLDLPTELPKENKEWLMEHIPTHIKDDPNLIEEYLEQNFERYKKSRMNISTGSIRIKVCVAPDSQTANEYLIYARSLTPLPTEAVKGYFSSQNRLEGIGTIAFSRPIMFVRDNIAVIIDARGELASEGLPLAKKIDALIQKQPVLTAQQIQARRPIISISANAEKDDYERKTATFKVSPPKGQEIVDVKAYINGKLAAIRDGKILIQGEITRPVKVKVVAVTSELIGNTFETEVTIPE